MHQWKVECFGVCNQELPMSACELSNYGQIGSAYVKKLQFYNSVSGPYVTHIKQQKFLQSRQERG